MHRFGKEITTIDIRRHISKSLNLVVLLTLDIWQHIEKQVHISWDSCKVLIMTQNKAPLVTPFWRKAIGKMMMLHYINVSNLEIIRILEVFKQISLTFYRINGQEITLVQL